MSYRERRDGSPPRSFFYRVLRAAFPLHLLLLLLLLLPCLIPLSENDPSCTVANNFARSFYPMLRYTNGPPPTWSWQRCDWVGLKEKRHFVNFSTNTEKWPPTWRIYDQTAKHLMKLLLPNYVLMFAFKCLTFVFITGRNSWINQEMCKNRWFN